MKITFVTDYVCPYCIVTKEAMMRAINELGIDAEVVTQPFELTQMTKPQVDTYSDPVRREHYKVLDAPTAKLGMNLHIPPAVIPRPYTHYAFEGFHYACEKGLGEAYSNAVYLAYFQDEKDIGNLDNLTDIASSVGLDGAEYRQTIEAHVYSDTVDEENRYDREVLHITHVPTIFIDGEELEGSAFSVEEWKDILLYKANTASEGSCGPDGCGEDGCGPEGCQ